MSALTENPQSHQRRLFEILAKFDLEGTGFLDKSLLDEAFELLEVPVLARQLLWRNTLLEEHQVDYFALTVWLYQAPLEPPRVAEESGVPLCEIRKLAQQHRPWLAKQAWNSHRQQELRPTMYEVVEQIVKPMTKTRLCSFAELLPPITPHVFVSHWWGEEFLEFVKTLKRFATVSSEGISANDVVFWICSLANRQWTVNLGATLESSPFERALQAVTCDTVLMVVDADMTPLRRIWCLYEVLRAHALGKMFHIGTAHGIVTFGSDEPHGDLRDDLLNLSRQIIRIDASNASASVESDLRMIHDAIEIGIGMKQFTIHVQSLLADAFTMRGGAQLSADDPDLALGWKRIQLAHKIVVCFHGRTDLHVASQLGNLETVMKLLQAQADVDHRTSLGQTPLHVAACFSDNVKVLVALIEARADVTLEDQNNLRASHLAAFAGKTASASFLLDSEAANSLHDHFNDDVGYSVGSVPKSHVVLAAVSGHFTCIELLVDRGATIHIAALVALSAFGQAESLKYLLRLVADLNTVLGIGSSQLPTPLAAAALSGNDECVAILLEAAADVNQIGGKTHVTAFLASMAFGRLNTAALLLAHRADPWATDHKRDSALILACGGGHVPCVQMMLTLKADANERNRRAAYTPLHNAANWNRSAVANILIDARALLNAQDNDGNTPLHNAAHFGYNDMVSTLVEHRADPIIMNSSNQTPYVIALEEEHYDVARLLSAYSDETDVNDPLLSRELSMF